MINQSHFYNVQETVRPSSTPSSHNYSIKQHYEVNNLKNKK